MSIEFNEALTAFRSGDLTRARSLAEAQVAEAPLPQWLHLLGLVHCRLGDAEAGIRFLEQAVDVEPGNDAFRLMLARALVDSGRATEVLAWPEPPPISSPMSLDLWRARGEAADAAGNPEAAAAIWRRVTVGASRDWRAWSNLGNALAAQGLWGDAGDALARAAELNPAELTIQRNAGSAFAQANRLKEALRHLAVVEAAEPGDAANHLLMAHALAGLQRHDEAIDQFEAARRLGDGTAATELGLGLSLIARGRFAEAEIALARAYELKPADREIVHQYGITLDRNNKPEALEKLLDDALTNGLDKNELSYLWAVSERRHSRLEEAHELLLRSEPDKDDAVAWYQLRARIADALGNAGEAFEAAAAMNRTARDAAIPPEMRDEWRQKTIDYRREQHEFARTITPQWASRVPLLTEPSPRRVAFLVGFPRSGTTLLDTFLMGHPQIEVLEEVQFVSKAAPDFDIKDLPTVSGDFLRNARASYLASIAESLGDFSGLVVDKFPLDMGAAPLIQAMFPGAPIIFAQRHPCDVVLSGFMQKFGMVNFGALEDVADYYDSMMSTWMAARDAMKLNTHTAIYEELIDDPGAMLKPLIRFLGLEWDERVLEHQRTARERGHIATPSYDQVTEPLNKRASGRWKRYREQMEPVLPVLLSWAERLGYSE